MAERGETRSGSDWLACPLPIRDESQVLLAHGGGGRRSQELIETLFLPAFDNPALAERHDGARLELTGPLAFSTDSYVVRPLFFPGGDIGSLSVNGTVNDLAMCGARPRYLSAGFIIEEGFSLATLRRVVESMRSAAGRAGVTIVTGDTKVVGRGQADGLFINTAGVGTIATGVAIGPRRIQPGDAVLLSGDLGRHGVAIMVQREELTVESEIESDCAPLVASVHALLDAGLPVHALRDLTRGGLTSGLVELAESSGLTIRIAEEALPISRAVRAVCELLGLDPLQVANEGRFVAFVPEDAADRALELLRGVPESRDAVRIGTVSNQEPGLVTLRTALGVDRVLDMLSGEQLPRIC